MVIPFWAMNESKKRKKSLNWGGMPVYEISLGFVDSKGVTKYKSMTLRQGASLSFSTLAKLVKDIEDEHYDYISKTGDGWYSSHGSCTETINAPFGCTPYHQT